MRKSEALQIIRDRVEARCVATGTVYRENTMTEAAVDVLCELLFNFGDEVGKLEQRIEELESRAHAEDNYAMEQAERN